MAKIQTKGNQAFNVPNNAEGKLFLSLARKFANYKATALRSNGRAADRKAAFLKCPSAINTAHNRRSHCPLDGSDWIALYVTPKALRRRTASVNRQVAELLWQIRQFTAANNSALATLNSAAKPR